MGPRHFWIVLLPNVIYISELLRVAREGDNLAVIHKDVIDIKTWRTQQVRVKILIITF